MLKMKEKRNDIWRRAQRRISRKEYKWGQDSLVLIKRIHSFNYSTGVDYAPSMCQALRQGTWHKKESEAQPLPLGVKKVERNNLYRNLQVLE
mgnify:CR=1 FL=1